MIRIARLNHVSLLVSDTQRALGFYHGLLRLPLVPERPDLGYPGAWLDAGNGQQIHLLEIPHAAPAGLAEHGGRDHHLALDVEDLDAVVSALTGAGIGFTLSRSGRRALFCRDPDGNAVEFIELPDPASG